MTDRDPLADALTLLASRPLDLGLASRVGARARAELHGPPKSTPGVAPLRWALGAGLVPALLTLAAVVETVETASTVAWIYGKAHHASSQ
jgi:hypothetical protein